MSDALARQGGSCVGRLRAAAGAGPETRGAVPAQRRVPARRAREPSPEPACLKSTDEARRAGAGLDLHDKSRFRRDNHYSVSSFSA